MKSRKLSIFSTPTARARLTRAPQLVLIGIRLSDHRGTAGFAVRRRGELKAAMRSLGFETKNPTIFQMIADLDQDGGAAVFDPPCSGLYLGFSAHPQQYRSFIGILTLWSS